MTESELSKSLKCANCGKELSQPHPDERHIVESICWHCGTVYYDPLDGFDEDVGDYEKDEEAEG